MFWGSKGQRSATRLSSCSVLERGQCRRLCRVTSASWSRWSSYRSSRSVRYGIDLRLSLAGTNSLSGVAAAATAELFPPPPPPPPPGRVRPPLAPLSPKSTMNVMEPWCGACSLRPAAAAGCAAGGGGTTSLTGTSSAALPPGDEVAGGVVETTASDELDVAVRADSD